MGKLVLSAIVIALLTAADTKEDAVKKDLAKMQGEWLAVGDESGGIQLGEQEVRMLKIKLVIKDDKYKIMSADTVAAEGTIKLDPSQKPAALDIVSTRGTMPAIYAFDGEKLKTCVAIPGGRRPTEFRSKEGSTDMLITYQKVK